MVIKLYGWKNVEEYGLTLKIPERDWETNAIWRNWKVRDFAETEQKDS